jgi:hypothetical protein
MALRPILSDTLSLYPGRAAERKRQNDGARKSAGFDWYSLADICRKEYQANFAHVYRQT